jgi:hypothetical protein
LSHNFVKMEKKLMEFAKCRNNCQITEKLWENPVTKN